MTGFFVFGLRNDIGTAKCYSTCFCPSHQYIWAATWQNQQSDCAPSEDSDQPGHPPSLIRVFAVRMKKAYVLSYPLSAQRRLIRLGGCPGWSESSLGAQSLCWFCHVAADLYFGERQRIPISMEVNAKPGNCISFFCDVQTYRQRHSNIFCCTQSEQATLPKSADSVVHKEPAILIVSSSKDSFNDKESAGHSVSVDLTSSSDTSNRTYIRCRPFGSRGADHSPGIY